MSHQELAALNFQSLDYSFLGQTDAYRMLTPAHSLLPEPQLPDRVSVAS